jgi:hypothetical protein
MKRIQSVYKTVSLKISDPEPSPEVEAMFRRMGEFSKLKAMLPAIDLPTKIGKHVVTKADERHFALTVAVSNRTNDAGQNQAFASAIAEAVKFSDARFFEVVAAGMRHAERQRAEGFSKATAHAFAALAAKLELEQEMDGLPDTLQVSKRASEIGRVWFKKMPFAIAGPSDKSTWSKARKASGIAYLDSPKRGPANRVTRRA